MRETLLFSARLRLPADTPPAARRARVDAVVRTLGLRACADTRVGSGLARGISGGERKRLALGVELVINPPLLFLDEPTSGLDAFNAQAVMSSLKLLASTGRAVVACLHQPRSSITTLFDALLLLSEGRVMFSGAAPDALPFFQRWGFACPEHTNPSDFYLDAISLSFHSPQAEAASRARVALLADAYASEQPAQLAALRAAARKAAAGDASAHALTESVVVPMDGPAADDKGNGSADSSVNVRHPRTVLRVLRRRSLEWGALASRAGRLAARQRLENAINLIRTCVFSVLLGLIWLNVGRKHTGAPSELRNLGGLLFFSIGAHELAALGADVRAEADSISPRSEPLLLECLCSRVRLRGRVPPHPARARGGHVWRAALLCVAPGGRAAAQRAVDAAALRHHLLGRGPARQRKRVLHLRRHPRACSPSRNACLLCITLALTRAGAHARRVSCW